MMNDLYKDIRFWIMSLIPDSDPNKAYQNGISMPEDAILMTILFETPLDQLTQDYQGREDDGSTYVKNSIQAKVQIDCYGKDAHARATKIASMWQTMYTTEQLQYCQPLYARRPRDLTFINETGQYELRFLVELDLQYNTVYDVSLQTFKTLPNTELNDV